MPVSKLFESWEWGIPVPEVFNHLEKSSTEHYSQYCDQKNKKGTLHSASLYALLYFLNSEHTSQAGAVGMQNEQYSVIEYVNTKNDIHVVFYNSTNGKFCSGIVTDTDAQPSAYELKDKKEIGTALIVSLIPFALRDMEFQKYYEQLGLCMADGFTPTPELAQAAYILCDNLYRRIGTAEQLQELGLKVSIPNSGKIPPLTELNLKNGYYSPTKILYGEFTFLNVKPVEPQVIKTDGFKCSYGNGRQYTSMELEMIPELKKAYIIPKEVPFVCAHISKTAQAVHPIRNILLRGESSTGKTSAAFAIACGLGRPMVAPITCHSDIGVSDFLLQAVPVSTENYIGCERGH